MDKVKTMKKTLIKLIILFSIVFVFVSCNDPIFFIVHQEIPILKPFIDGSPTNFVILNKTMYVASGKQIYSYSGSSWSKWSKLDGRVVDLAVTSNSLYAIYLNSQDSGDGTIRNCTSGSNLSLSNVQSIHAAGDVLFACTRNNDNKYSIHFRKEGASSFKSIPYTSREFMLNGAASNDTYYYLCTSEGIYYASKSLIDTPSTLPDKLPVIEENKNFVGIIELNNNFVAAITDDGKLFEINGTSTRTAAELKDRLSSGALALWKRYKDDTMPSLLLVGRRDFYYSTSSSYTNGYVEIALNTTTGGIAGSSFNDPGTGTPSSIDNYDRYVSSLGKKPVNHIIQTPPDINPKMTLFAATHQDGVWSYKDRGNGKGEQWNAED